MMIELLPGTTNVVRFPTEGRAAPTVNLLREIAPDVREVGIVAETYSLDLPSHDFRHWVDAEVAEHIVNHVDPRPGPVRTRALQALLTPLLAGAVEACREARRASTAADETLRRIERAEAEGGYPVEALEERAEVLSRHAAELLLAAFVRSEEAEGVARAVSLARSGQAWMPFDVHAEAEALLFGAVGSRAQGGGRRLHPPTQPEGNPSNPDHGL
jgi:hypothetical protein